MSPKLKDGPEWIDHEDCIVGDEEGLRNLIVACEAAIDKGEHYSEGLGDYVGVKKLDTDWFIDPMDSKETRFANAALGVVLLVLFGLIIIGAGSVFSWLTQGGT